MERSGAFLDSLETLGNIVAERSKSELPAIYSQLLSRLAYTSTGGFDPVDTERERIRSDALPRRFQRHCGIPPTLWRGTYRRHRERIGQAAVGLGRRLVAGNGGLSHGSLTPKSLL